jgi:hypothetical protein
MKLLINPNWKTKAVHSRDFLSTLETPLFTVELMRQDGGWEVWNPLFLSEMRLPLKEDLADAQLEAQRAVAKSFADVLKIVLPTPP